MNGKLVQVIVTFFVKSGNVNLIPLIHIVTGEKINLMLSSDMCMWILIYTKIHVDSNKCEKEC